MNNMAINLLGQEIELTENMPLVVLSSTAITSYIKGYHVYKSQTRKTTRRNGTSQPCRQIRQIQILSTNTTNTNLVAVKKDGKLVGHLPLGENGNFAKIIFYFLRVDQFGRCDITVTGKAVNLGDGDGLQVPCVLSLSGQKSMVEFLKKQKL